MNSATKLLSKLYKPNKEIISCAKNLVNMIEDNKEASLLLAKIDGFEKQLNAEELLSTKYQDILNDMIASSNCELIRSPTFKHIRLRKDYSRANTLQLWVDTLGSKTFSVRLNIEDGTNPTNEQLEWMYRQLLMSIFKEGIFGYGK